MRKFKSLFLGFSLLISILNPTSIYAEEPSEESSSETVIEEAYGEQSEQQVQPSPAPANVFEESTGTDNSEPDDSNLGSDDNVLDSSETEEELESVDDTDSPEDEIKESEDEEDSNILFEVPEDFVLSSSDNEGKAVLNEYDLANVLSTLSEGSDYKADELMFLAESAEYAEQVAEIYHGELSSFSDGIAVIKIIDPAVSVEDAVTAALDSDMNLPLVEPNYIVVNEPSPVDDGNSIESFSIDTNSYLPKVNTWNDWVNDEFEYPDPFISTPSSYDYQWQHEVLDTYAGWNSTTGDHSIKVAVIDTGINPNHEDLIGKVTVEDIGCGTYLGNGHGTHVAGIIAATVNNGVGGAGIAPDVDLISINIFNNSVHADDDDLARAINRAVSLNVDIINMSLGDHLFNWTVYQTILNAYNSGIVICAAAGNEGSNIKSFPAAYDHVIAVAATTRNNSRAFYSNYGPWIDISAPGSNILSTDSTDEEPLNDGYSFRSGTSMSSAVVAGAIALYMSKMGHVKPDAMLSVLKKSTIPCSSSQMGAGIISVQKLFNKKESAPGIEVYTAEGQPITSFSSAVPEGSYVIIKDLVPNDSDTIIYTTDGKKPSIINGQIINGQVYEPGTRILMDDFTKGTSVTFYAAVINSLGVLGNIKKLTVKAPAVKVQPLKVKTVKLNCTAKTVKYSSKADNPPLDLYTTSLLDTKGNPLVLDDVEHKWISSNVKVATVDENGSVTFVGPGTAKITLKFLDGSKKSIVCTLTVVQLAEQISITGQDGIAPGGSATYTASVLPSSTKNKKVSWELLTDDPGIKLGKAGKVTVSANTESESFTLRAIAADGSGIIGEKTINICQKVTSISLNTEDTRAVYNPKTGILSSIQLFTTDIIDDLHADIDERTFKLDADIEGNNLPPVWSTSNAKVATVDQLGNVTAISAGTAKITCAANDGSKKKATVTVKVTVPISSLNIELGDYNNLSIGKTLNLKNKISYGTQYGNPTTKSVNWSISEVFYFFDDVEYDITDSVLTSQYVKIVKNEKLSVSTKITNIVNPNAVGNVYAVLRAESKDGTDYYSEAIVNITGPLNGITFDDPYGYGYYVRPTLTGYSYRVALYSEQPVNFEISSNKPNVLGAYIDYESIEEDYFWIRKNGKVTYYHGYSYWVYYYAYPDKYGTATLTVKALDGSNKTTKLKIQVKK